MTFPLLVLLAAAPSFVQVDPREELVAQIQLVEDERPTLSKSFWLLGMGVGGLAIGGGALAISLTFFDQNPYGRQSTERAVFNTVGQMSLMTGGVFLVLSSIFLTVVKVKQAKTDAKLEALRQQLATWDALEQERAGPHPL